MQPSQIATLEDVFRAVFELPDGADVTTLAQGVSEKWDSLAHVSLVAAIESQFNVVLDVADQLDLTSFDAAARILDERLS